MSHKIDILHSHSALERALKMPKHTVLVDEKFKDLFMKGSYKEFSCQKIKYIKVNTYDFYKKGGVFKNLLS